MSNKANLENPSIDQPDNSSNQHSGAHCSTYTFPDIKCTETRGHLRSISHGGSSSITGVSAPGSGARTSALKGSRGHQRAFSQGQISDSGAIKSTHTRVSSKTDFILPPGHKDGENQTAATATKGHSRQASRTESVYTLRRTAPPPLWQQLLCFLLRRKPKNDLEERSRIVVPNHIVPPKTPRKVHPNGQRMDNKIRTTKYTWLSFLPRNLLEQFHRVANLYFIFIVLLNWFPAINAFGKEIAMIPVIFVLGVTAVKDLFEDRRRRASDDRINNSTCRTYDSQDMRYRKVSWKDVRVGDLIHLSNNEVVPADILLLKSSDPSGCCFIDTGHLDGETNLKQRQVARGFVKRDFSPCKFKSTLEVDAPTTKIYRFQGTIIHPSGETVPVGTENLILRECLLKNTDFVEGIVVYAGHETKAMLNNGGPRYKRSSLERQMNLDVIWCVAILIFLCIICAIGCKLWLKAYSNVPEPFKSEYGDTTEAVLAFFTFVIILQIMIPLSLYVTLELCKMMQIYHIHRDIDMYDKVMNKRVECRALNITEELGQIQYIFSDKTGTLTENKMIFRRCAIAGKDYNHPELQGTIKGSKSNTLSVVVNPELLSDLHHSKLNSLYSSKSIHAHRVQEFLMLLAICNTVVCSQHPHHDLMNASGIIESMSTVYPLQKSNEDLPPDLPKPDVVGSEHITIKSHKDRYLRLEESRSVTPSPPLHSHQYSTHVSSLTPIDSVDSSPSSDVLQTQIKSSRPKILNVPSINFLSKKNTNSDLTDEQNVKLYSTTTPSPCELKPIFEAESPDELALVDAAYNYNCRLVSRTPTSVTVNIRDDECLNFEILNVLPFDSTRKRMSVIIKHPVTKEIILYCKGADSSILPYVNTENDVEQILDKTQQHLNCYARDGLRVLVMAKRVLTQREYTDWYQKHLEVERSLFNFDKREKKVRDSYSSIEKNLFLLGATGIEDRLQEGVPETLQSLISAGIVVWVLTGDKPETALNIAYSAKLFSPQMDLLNLMARSKEAAEEKILYYLEQIQKDQRLSNALYREDGLYRQASGSASCSRTDQKNSGRALIVDGKTLTFILDRRSKLTEPFLKLTTLCNSVLCCRATPLQKAYIVKVVKEELKMRTLAIGDGANDVSMIQTADVGIGISGQEGMQAVMAADFSLSRFKFLEKFLLVHGHWSYDRLSRMVQYFFYKNAAFVFLILWYQIYCGFSGSVMIDQMYLMLYNLLFTSLPPLAIGVYDQDAPEELLKEKPYLYKQGRLGKVYRSYSFWITTLDAIYQSICIFFICQGAYADSDIDIFEFGCVVTTCCMFVMVLHASVETRSWTILHLVSVSLSIGAFYFYSLLYNSVCVSCFGLPSTYWIIQKAAMKSTYWFVALLSCVAAILPRFTIRILKNTIFPDDVTRALISKNRRGREPPITGLRIKL